MNQEEELPQESPHACTLVSEFQILEFREISVCCLSYTAYGSFVIAAQTKTTLIKNLAWQSFK